MPAPATKPKADQKLRLSVSRFKVNREAGKLSDLALLSADREAKGHGLYIDARTLETALEAIEAAGGEIKAYLGHETLSQWWEGEDRLLQVPGWFSDISIRGGILTAGAYQFYDSFREAEPAVYARLLEMAEKTPKLFGLSIEAWGHAVYVAKDGTEYSALPEDVELEHDGMPAFRVVDLRAAAFVSDPAANDGLFARMGRRVRGFSDADLRDLADALSAYAVQHSFQSAPPIDADAKPATHTTTEAMLEKLLNALRAKFGTDPARYGRAVELALKVSLTEGSDIHAEADKIAASLAKAEEEAELRAKAAKFEALEKEKADLEKRVADAEKRFADIKESGHLGTVSTGAPAVVGLKGKPEGLTAAALSSLQERGRIGVNFAITDIGDLWVPDVWIRGMDEYVPLATDFLGSGAVSSSPVLNAAAQGGGSTINVPFLIEPDDADENQAESTAPTVHNITSGQIIAPRLNRVTAVGATALAAGLSGSDPVGFARNIAGGWRNRNRLRALINSLRGLFGTDGTAAYAALRIDAFDETGNDATADQLFDGDIFMTASATLGEMASVLERGAILCHSAIHAAMTAQDDIDYIKPSEGMLRIPLYKGRIPVFVSDLLVRAGTTNGSVYDTYVFAPGSVAMGYKPQTNRVGDVASLVMGEDEAKNETTLYDRTSGYIVPRGAKWTGTPADTVGGPTNTELAAMANWDLALNSAKNVGIVCIKTNG